MTADQPPKPTIAELDATLSRARESWLSAPTPALKRKAMGQINEMLDLRIGMMDARDLAPVLELELH